MIDLTKATDSQIRHYLVDRGFEVSGLARVERLAGGVSGTVLRVNTARGPVVCKQALERLDVPMPWQADRRRVLTEARALETFGRLTPDLVPRLLDTDEQALVLIMTCAPDDWWPWKQRLLSGEKLERSAEVARQLATGLAQWHSRTAGDAELFQAFDDHETYRLLRTDPFYKGLAETHPALADRLTELADGLHQDPVCLIHGDFSPKNVLVGDQGMWVLDHEVAIAGRPVFDLAFMIAHLILKSVERNRRELVDVADEFWRTYQQKWDGSGVTEEPLGDHVAVLMLARIDGLSRVHYLSERQESLVRKLAGAHLEEGGGSLRDLFSRAREFEGPA